MADELEKLREDQEKAMSDHDRYCSRLGAMPDQSFSQYVDEAISMSERTKAREPQPVKEISAEERQLNAMSGAEFSERLRDLGVNGSTDLGSLSDAMEATRRSRGNKDARDWEE